MMLRYIRQLLMHKRGWTGLHEGYGAETLADGFNQAINDFGKPGYAGPAPPPGAVPHHYHFRLSALSEASVPVASSATCLEVIVTARPYVIEFVELVGLYGRYGRIAVQALEAGAGVLGFLPIQGLLSLGQRA